MRSTAWKSRSAALGLVLVTALGAAACSSTNSASTTTTTGSGTTAQSPSIPQSAFSDHTGVSSNEVQVANVSTLSLGLFKGAQVGTEAYAAYVNSSGGVNGRKIVVNDADDGFTGAGNKQATENALQNDFSKKWDNLWAAYCLHFAYYNFCRIHKTLRVTPAMEAGLTT